jgi:hypothetical protein
MSKFDGFEGSVDAGEVYMKMEIVIKYPDCGGLHIFWDGFDKPQMIYKIEH